MTLIIDNFVSVVMDPSFVKKMFLLLKDIYRRIYGWNYSQIFALNTSVTTITGMSRKWGLRNNLEKEKKHRTKSQNFNA